MSLGSGRKPVLPMQCEIELATCLSTMARWGFGLTREEVKQQVQVWIQTNKEKQSEFGIKLADNPFKDDCPGDDWLRSFMERHKLSSKKPSQLEKARKTATSDPFIIYGFYNLVEKCMNELKILHKHAYILNLDETGMSIDPVNTKVVAPKGEKASRVTGTPGRESITVLACISADGNKLPPLIIFSGKNLQSTWKGQNAYPGTTYAVSDKGWMVTEIFESWFENFCRTVVQRPLLIIYDGHATHLSLNLIQKAR